LCSWIIACEAKHHKLVEITVVNKISKADVPDQLFDAYIEPVLHAGQALVVVLRVAERTTMAVAHH
jgi:hypothetical protein